MTNMKPLIKRVCAYTIDITIILIISSLISSIPFINKDIDNYQKTYSEYENEYNKYVEYIALLEETYKDEEINEEEYKKLNELEKYQEIVSAKYNDNKISKGEYKEIISKINEEFDKTANNYIYLLNKNSIMNSSITLLCTLLYFGVLQYFLNGQTLGKKFLKLKIIKASDKKLNIFNYIFRSLIINEVLLKFIDILFLALASKSLYINANNIINTIISIIEAIIIYLVLTRTDRRGLHDLLCNTQVISTDGAKPMSTEPVEKTTKESIEKIIEAEYKEIKNKKSTSEKKAKPKKEDSKK